MPPSVFEMESLLKPFTADAVMNGVTTLIGAFLGAMLAFLFQLCLNRRQDQKAALMSTHRILFCLLQQMNTILLVHKDYIFPHLNNPGRFISIPAIHEFDIEKNSFDFSTFSFMLESSESRAIMYDLYLAQESYIEALRALNERSRLHKEEVQPRLASAGIGNGSMITDEIVKLALGPLVFPTVVTSTNQVIDVMKSAFGKLAKSKNAFRAYAVKRFKTQDFTDFDFPETNGLY